MLSLRLQKIADFVNKGEIIIDVGTDHAFVPIYLMEKKIVSVAYASDISEKALLIAKNNIEKHQLENKIKLFLADGLQNINETFNVVIIAGLGASSIIKIVENNLKYSFIISSNNHEELIRSYFYNHGYYLLKEEDIYEKNHYYVIMRFEKGIKKISQKEILFGKNLSKDYYLNILKKYQTIIKKVPLFKKGKLLIKIIYLKKIINGKKQD